MRWVAADRRDKGAISRCASQAEVSRVTRAPTDRMSNSASDGCTATRWRESRRALWCRLSAGRPSTMTRHSRRGLARNAMGWLLRVLKAVSSKRK